jgi:hypothetical protein
MDETGYPFHIAELEKLLLLQEQNAIVNDIEGKQEANEEVKGRLDNIFLKIIIFYYASTNLPNLLLFHDRSPTVRGLCAQSAAEHPVHNVGQLQRPNEQPTVGHGRQSARLRVDFG